MSHELFGERFTSLRRPAWHGLGIVHNDEIGARESLKVIGGQPTVTLEPLYTETAGVKIELPNRSILRHPTEDDPEYVHFGIVGPRYELLTLQDVANIWDAVVGKPIETMGFLHRGANAFMTSKMPAIDVKGDEIERYVLLTTPLDGMKVATVEETDVRVVCQNTLRAAQAQSISTCRVVHDSHAQRRIAVWLKEAYERAERNASVIKEAFEVLTTKSVTPSEVDEVLAQVYPNAVVRDDFTVEPRIMERRVALAESHNNRQERYREAVLDLFEGKGRGMDTTAAKGTAWGLYNGVVELEDYRKGTNRGDKSEGTQVAEATMFGTRAAIKERAFESCVTLVRGEELADISLN